MKKSVHQVLNVGVQGITHHRPPRKAEKSYYKGSKRASGLPNLLSCHHRADGKGSHMPVGDNLEVEG